MHEKGGKAHLVEEAHPPLHQLTASVVRRYWANHPYVCQPTDQPTEPLLEPRLQTEAVPVAPQALS